MKRSTWRQIWGDVNPSQHGAVIARFDGQNVEVIEIQPVRAYVGEAEALEVGYPFWSKCAYYSPEDLDGAAEAMRSAGLEESELAGLSRDERALAVAAALLSYGTAAEEGEAGWARDVLGNRRVRWWRGKLSGWRYLADEDREYRALQREARS